MFVICQMCITFSLESDTRGNVDMNIKGYMATAYYRWKSTHSKLHVKLFSKVALDGRTTFGGHNIIGTNSSILSSSIGYMTYIGNNCFLNCCEIGKFCSIGDSVRIISGTHPTKNFVSTHPAFYSVDYVFSFSDKELFEEQIYVDKAKRVKVKIGNDVWLASDCKILGGVTIGDGAIVAAGAVVTKDVEPYSIVGGVPATYIRKRFSDDEIEELLSIEWWNKSENYFRDNYCYFTNINKFLRRLKE